MIPGPSLALSLRSGFLVVIRCVVLSVFGFSVFTSFAFVGAFGLEVAAELFVDWEG